MSDRKCYWHPEYINGSPLVLSGVDNAKYVNIDSLSDERKQKAWSYIKENNPELAELMQTKELKDFKKEAQEIFNAKQVIEI